MRARNAAQDRYLAALRKHELVFAEGPAGTGKTWLAVGHAVSLLEQGIVERLVLSRPAVEAGERLGFLPGDMRDKVDPYLRPIYDALYDFMEGRMVERGIQTGMIEIAPLAFMRGRTLSKAAILLDEAQNATAMQMKMFLTRLGEGSRMMVNGDPTQTDLAAGAEIGAQRRHRAARAGWSASATSASATATSCATTSCVRSSKPTKARSPRGRTPSDETSGRVRRDFARAGAPRSRRERWRARRSRRASPNAASRFGPAPNSAFTSPTTRIFATSTPVGAASTRRPTSCPFPRSSRRISARRAFSGTSSSPSKPSRARRPPKGKPLADHYRHLVVHGFLHLIGFDHETDAEAQRMEAMETRILARLGVADPYRASELVDAAS